MQKMARSKQESIWRCRKETDRSRKGAGDAKQGQIEAEQDSETKPGARSKQTRGWMCKKKDHIGAKRRLRTGELNPARVGESDKS